MKKEENIYDFYWNNIRKTVPNEFILVKNLLIGILNRSATRALIDLYKVEIDTIKVFFPSRSLKHIYEKRPAWAYDLIIANTKKILCYPDSIH